MPQGIKLFKHKKYAKMLLNPPHVLSHKPNTSKKQRHFVLFADAKSTLLQTLPQNHCVLGLLVQLLLLYSCFFDLASTGDWRSCLARVCDYWTYRCMTENASLLFFYSISSIGSLATTNSFIMSLLKPIRKDLQTKTYPLTSSGWQQILVYSFEFGKSQ